MTVTCLECVEEASFECIRLGKVHRQPRAELGVDVHHLGCNVTQRQVADHVILLEMGEANQLNAGTFLARISRNHSKLVFLTNLGDQRYYFSRYIKDKESIHLHP